jgi:hypothetical protein
MGDAASAQAGKRSIVRFGRIAVVLALIFLHSWAGAAPARAQTRDEASIIHHIDAANQARVENVLGFTDREHYAVFRGADQTHPAAEMTVVSTYRKGTGKSYSIVSQSGSSIIRRFGLQPLLDQEKKINEPRNVEESWFTSANYEMHLKPGVTRNIGGRDCIAVSISPKHKAPNMIEGTLWVDAKDDSEVEVEGVASQSPSIFTGRTQMMRQYRNIDGFAMATHARAESDSHLFGKTVVVIDYSDYKIEVRSAARRVVPFQKQRTSLKAVILRAKDGAIVP